MTKHLRSRPSFAALLIALTSTLILGAGTSASAMQEPNTPEKFPPDIMMDELYGSKGTVFAHGQLIMPHGISVEQGCKGRVKAIVRKSGKIVGSKKLLLSAKRDCWFNGMIATKARSGLRLTIVFPGNTELAPVAKTFKVSEKPPFQP